MTTLAEKIKLARLALNMSQSDLAKKSGVTQGTIGHLETGRSNATTKLPAIAKALNTTVESLVSGTSDYQPSYKFAARLAATENAAALAELNDPEHIWIDGFEYQFDADDGSIHWNRLEKRVLRLPLPFFASHGADPARCKVLTIKSDSSMEPFLFDHDQIVIDTGRVEPRESKIFAMTFEGEALVKQVFKEAGGALRLHSLNPRYPDKIIAAEHLDGLKIVGQYLYRAGPGFAV
ncbi:XRE family transcriptional regulator [Caballeronia fortuita]|nr:LexA family transcriptional regulator [Caballeronia fortuita]